MNVLLLPGLHRAMPPALDAWAAQGARVIEQHDWVRPLRGDWLMQLENAVIEREAQTSRDVQLVAYGLGCWLAASWAQATPHAKAIDHALLIDPPTLSAPELQVQLPSWQRIVLQALPFAATVVTSASVDAKARETSHHAHLARAWGASHHTHHIELAQLQALCMKEETHGH